MCISNDFSEQETKNIELETEENPFRSLNIEGVLVEIRTFDTSFFEIFSENEIVIRDLSDRFKNSEKKQ